MNKKFLIRLGVAASFAASCMCDSVAQTSAKKGNSSASGERAAIRVLCEGRSAEAMISINGIQKGNCPLDLEVSPGLIKVRALKRRDEFYDSVFALDFNLGAGAARRVEVVFNERKQFRADAVARVDKEVDISERAMENQRKGDISSLETIAASGDATAMTRLALFYKRGLTGPIDMKKSLDWYKKGAEAGDPVAMYEYGSELESGRVIPKDKALAIEFYKRSAAMGNPAALFRIGMFLSSGSEGFPKDNRLAGTYFKKSAEGGYGFASTMWVGTLPESEQAAAYTTEESLIKVYAKVQIEKAASGEDFEDMESAANIYRNGAYGNGEDPGKALFYYRMAWRQIGKAAAAGDPWSVYALGRRSEGIGMPPDIAAATRYYRKAQQMGSPDAREALAKLQSQEAK